LWKFGAAERLLWSLQRKPLLLGAAQEKTHSASRCVAEKNPKCFVTVNIVAKCFSKRGAARSASLLDPFGDVLRRSSKKLLRDLRGDFARLH
jgi:hypothetical protein